MRAGDTVMTEIPQISMSLAPGLSSGDLFKEFLNVVQREREAQAEITWDIAFKAGVDEAIKKYCQYSEDSLKLGRQEVVEWIESQRTFVHTLIHGISKGIPLSEDKWQAKLKDWGIEK